MQAQKTQAVVPASGLNGGINYQPPMSSMLYADGEQADRLLLLHCMDKEYNLDILDEIGLFFTDNDLRKELNKVRRHYARSVAKKPENEHEKRNTDFLLQMLIKVFSK